MTEEILMLGIGLILEGHSTLLIIHLKRISLCKEIAPLCTIFLSSLNSKRAEGWKESEQRQRNIGRRNKVGSFDPFTKELRQFKMKESLTTFKKENKEKEEKQREQ